MRRGALALPSVGWQADVIPYLAPNRSGGRRGVVAGGRDFQAARVHSPPRWRRIPKGPPECQTLWLQ
jgi:hypothetical protein